MATIDQEYLNKHPKSAQLFQESAEVFADGVTHDTRYVTPFPVVMTHASGPTKWDVDDNEYVDYVCGHGALILGHSHPAISSAVARAQKSFRSSYEPFGTTSTCTGRCGLVSRKASAWSSS